MGSLVNLMFGRCLWRTLHTYPVQRRIKGWWGSLFAAQRSSKDCVNFHFISRHFWSIERIYFIEHLAWWIYRAMWRHTSVPVFFWIFATESISVSRNGPELLPQIGPYPVKAPWPKLLWDILFLEGFFYVMKSKVELKVRLIMAVNGMFVQTKLKLKSKYHLGAKIGY